MTVATFPVRIPTDITGYDRAVSEEGKRMASRLHDLLQFPDPYAATSFKGESLERLETVYLQSILPNWDGDDALPVAPSTVEYAKHFLRLLPSRVAEPDIYAEPDGEIAFEWDCGPRKVFSVSIGRDGTLTYAGLFGPFKSHGVETMVDRIPEVVRIGLDRVTS